MSQSQQQWIRKGSLIVATRARPGVANPPGLDLSELRYRFDIRQQDAQSPNVAVIRVYNLNDETAKAIESEFVRVVLQAGYVNAAYGVIFDGTIQQTRRGHEQNVDSYLDIFAAEGDLPYNFAIVNTSLAPGASPQQQIVAINNATAPYGATVDSSAPLIGGTLPRGKVLFGMALAHLDVVTQTTGYTWVISGGKIVPIPLTGYLPGEAVVLNSQSGLIGQPEATQQGIQATCLINPKIRVGTRVQINNELINRVVDRGPGIQPNYENPFAGAYASVTNDGFYRVIVQEFEGDSRGNPWYSKLTCLAVDPSAPPAQSVQQYP